MAQVNQQDFISTFPNRRRPITVCLECYRRKLKCNRVKPCIQCCTRKAPETCYFADDVSSSQSTPTPQTRVDRLEAYSDIDTASQIPIAQGLVERAGYSATSASSTYLRLNDESVQRHHQSITRLTPMDLQGFHDEYRHLVSKLPQPTIVHALIDCFLTEIFWASVPIDEYRLRTLYNDWLNVPLEEHLKDKSDHSRSELLYLPALLFQVLANVMLHLTPQHGPARNLGLKDNYDCARLSKTFSLFGNRLMFILGRQRPTLCSVEHDLVACSWLKDSGRGKEAWHSLANAVRQAQELGLHRLPQDIVPSEHDRDMGLRSSYDLEQSKKAFNTLFTYDSIGSFLLGRPRLMHREDISTPAPTAWKRTQDIAGSMPSPDNGFQDVVGMLFLNLAHQIHDIRSFSANGIFASNYLKVAEVHGQLSSLREMILLSLQEHGQRTATTPQMLRRSHLRLTLLNTVDAVIIALHRPFIGSHSTSHSAALTAALDGLDLQHSIFDLIPHPQVKQWATTLSIIETSVFLCGIMIDLPPQDPAEGRRIRQAILLAIGRLSATKDLSPLAEAGEQVLRQFYQKIQSARQPMLDHGESHQLSAVPEFLFQQSGQLSDIPIPPPQQAPEEMYQTLFGDQQTFLNSFGLFQNESSPFEYSAYSIPEEILNTADFHWPET
ncbi:uncharacterized protein PV06_10966 [Exophiala oligosperma]|uniref:Zn(2)-C6 fungal-type domain-containing protein n=2 Tax=Chaetothyriales TaxID=34395 RepID=A0A0D2A939_9EURO|nr:uncharacterized protein PV06_10966 [Exophiala oligosperma]KIW36851.1 hypothetical protein PV06_10966 [Exophiala oligosperma]